MNLPLSQFPIRSFSGVNYADPHSFLLNKAFSPNDGGWAQHAPLESPDLRNIDFKQQGIGKRLGSSNYADMLSATRGITWAEQANPKNFALNGITYGNGLYIAVGVADGTDAYLVTSPDGTTWTERVNPKNIQLLDVIYGNGLYVAVGVADGTDAYLVTSPDGITWTERTNAKNFTLQDIIYGNGLYVAVGNADGTDAYIVTSTDGITWTERANPKDISLQNVAYGNGLYVAVGDPDGTDAYLITSPDGITWTERTNSKDKGLYGVVYGNGLYVAVGVADGTDAYLITSPDGTTWTERTNPKNFALNGITYGNGLYVAVGGADGTDAYIVTSPDGTTWTERTNAKNFTLEGITYNNGLYVAVGGADGTDAYIVTSPNSSEIFIAGIEWVTPGTTTRVQVVVSSISIYTNQSGSWVKLKSPDGVANFAWGTAPTKCSLVKHDGHLFILANNNQIQVYRSGANLDDAAYHHTTTTTVDADSAAGQKVLSVAATTVLNVGDAVLINTGGAREERGYIASISAGVSITLNANLTYAHTAAQADVVQTDNKYVEAFGGASQNFAGVWNTSYYIGFALHGRLCMSTGDSVLEYTAAVKAYDRANGGYYQADGNIVAGMPWVPRGGNELSAVGFLSTTAGPEFFSGFDASDEIKLVNESNDTALNHKCLVAVGSWMIYLTDQRAIKAINLVDEIDLGRRFLAYDGASGPLDTINDSQAVTTAFGFYNQKKKQVHFFIPTGSYTTNDTDLVIDFWNGEPVPGETKEQFEQHVRCLVNNISDPTSNPWFINIYNIQGSVIGLLANGISYTLDSGNEDLDNLTVADYYYLPDNNFGAPFNIKIVRHAIAISQSVGDYPLYFDNYINGVTTANSTWNYRQTVTTGDLVTGHSWVDLAGISYKVRIRNQNAGETWQLNSLLFEYQLGKQIF